MWIEYLQFLRSRIFVALFINIAKLIINLVILNGSRIQNQIRIKNLTKRIC